ncbi:MAG: hypothetical protein EZS28_039948, partial [Streblomastix strix]
MLFEEEIVKRIENENEQEQDLAFQEEIANLRKQEEDIDKQIAESADHRDVVHDIALHPQLMLLTGDSDVTVSLLDVSHSYKSIPVPLQFKLSPHSQPKKMSYDLGCILQGDSQGKVIVYTITDPKKMMFEFDAHLDSIWSTDESAQRTDKLLGAQLPQSGDKLDETRTVSASSDAYHGQIVHIWWICRKQQISIDEMWHIDNSAQLTVRNKFANATYLQSDSLIAVSTNTGHVIMYDTRHTRHVELGRVAESSIRERIPSQIATTNKITNNQTQQVGYNAKCVWVRSREKI